MPDKEFFTEYADPTQYQIQVVIGEGNNGVVGAAVDTHQARGWQSRRLMMPLCMLLMPLRILREIKLFRHPDIVEIKNIMLPPRRREFKVRYCCFWDDGVRYSPSNQDTLALCLLEHLHLILNIGLLLKS